MPDEPTNVPSLEAEVARWQARVLDAKEYWKDDFDGMESNMAFSAGYQWYGQTKKDHDQYTANLTNRAVNHKVASLYARNPKAIARRRERLDFSIWSGEQAEIVNALQIVATTDPLSAPPASLALLNDYMQGMQHRQMLEKIGKTLEIVYQHQVDRQEPEFKKQMKQLVRRVVTTGVGYVKLSFVRESEEPLSSDRESTVVGLSNSAEEITRRIDAGDIDQDHPDYERLRTLANSISEGSAEPKLLSERLTFDFPGSTEIIVDPCCRCLKDFVGAEWVAQEYMMPREDMNALFGVDVPAGGEVKEYNERDDKVLQTSGTPSANPKPTNVRLWEIWDKTTGSRCVILEGWKNYIVPPAPVYPKLGRFWPVFAISFNDIEAEGCKKVTIFPPSDIQLMKSAQMEWNRTREELKRHREANRPKYLTQVGWLQEDDDMLLANAPSNSIVKLKGLPAGMKAGDMLEPLRHAPIDPALYDVEPLRQDMLVAVGVQEANLGPLSGGTATEASIAEQSRMSTMSSNVDDLDDLLTDLARASGELLVSEMSAETVKNIAGPGAVWPEGNRDFIANEIMLVIEAASSGRPNQAVEVANYERIAPILQAAGADPMFLIREGARRLDDRIDLSKAFPTIPIGPAPISSPQPLPEQAALPLTGI